MCYLFISIMGLVVGSFINVIIYRLPKILLGEKITLSWPVSHCPKCKCKIKVYHNVPLLGWLWLKGRCRNCQQAIHWRYPLVELLTAFLFTAHVTLHGINVQSLLDLLMLSLLIPLLFIDLEVSLLPDRLTLPLLALALGCAMLGYSRVTLIDSMFAATLGFGIPWLLDKIYFLRHKRAAMGMGDMKLFAAIGAWFGTEALFNIMLFSSLLAIVVALLLLRKRYGEAFPFGPYMIIVTIACMLSHS
ncbi:prepilin peptidase [Serratia odorifera]|uniref:prepilin peptidase n=1 Tax=Serratia odorifera TaxID=618 RepID=UPI0018E715B1|nr:A24 family peptidase [Serratia odorifera]MBJ2066828.1 prepilin peptidase [Serratia odorifera]